MIGRWNQLGSLDGGAGVRGGVQSHELLSFQQIMIACFSDPSTILFFQFFPSTVAEGRCSK